MWSRSSVNYRRKSGTWRICTATCHNPNPFPAKGKRLKISICEKGAVEDYLAYRNEPWKRAYRRSPEWGKGNRGW
jgi:hypothetical protein